MMDPAQLTPAQLMLWTGQQLAPDSPQYNSFFTFDLHGPLDAERFRTAFGRLTDASDAMRTVFHSTSGEVRQEVLDRFPGALEMRDWADGRDRLTDWAVTRGSRCFDLGRCCVDAVLLRLAPDHHVFFLNQHHLIVDAWGVGVQYAYLYRAYRAGAGAGAGSVPSFREYRRNLAAAAETLPAYWADRATPAPPQLLGRGNPAGESRSPRIYRTLAADRLDALAARPGVRHFTPDLTRFTILAAALTTFVYRLSGEGTLALGTPAAFRGTPAERELPAQLIEMLPLYGEVRAGDSFLDVIGRQRDSVSTFLRAARPGTTRAALAGSFNTVLNYLTVRFDDLADDITTRARWLSPGHADPGHHLRLQVQDLNNSGDLSLAFDLNAAVFTPADRERVPEQFLRLLKAVLREPERDVDTVDLLGDTERERLLAAGRGAKARPSATVPQLIARQAAETPDAVAVEDPEARLTYRELDRRSGQLAALLARRLPETGAGVGLFLPRSADLLVAILACWKAGHTYVPLPTNMPAGRLEHILEETGCRLILSDRAHYGGVTEYGIATLLLDEDQRAIAAQEPLAPVGRYSAPAYIMYTSGSTGTPKGVVIGHAALANYIDYARRHYATVPAPVFPLFTTIGFDLTVTSLFTPLTCGGRIVVYPEPPAGTPDLSVVRVMEEDRCDVVKLTPSHLALLRGRDYRQNRLRTLIVGGEAFTGDLAREIGSILPAAATIVNEYGPTEATVGCVAYSFSAGQPPEDTAVPIGAPLDNTEALVLDGSLRLAPDGVAGDLYVGGTCLADGYWRRADLTADRFVDHPYRPGAKLYRTGDRARRGPGGELRYLGRDDRQAKWRGYRIELDEVEHLLAAHPGISAVAVDLVDPTGWKQTPVDHHCTRCGLPANYPSISFDAEGVCQLCRGFDAYAERARAYFRTPEDFRALFTERASDHGAEYDCIMLLSGGKDSTYALGQLVEMGLKVLAFTLDNGYISRQALDNIHRVAEALGVDVHIGGTPAMNEIFVDSLHRHCNVCNGCFKTIYTLSTQLALEKNIPYIVTGLSRGQFFETRLSEELFWKEDVAGAHIDHAILEARKVYHRADDAVRELLDTSVFDTDDVFERVRFLDFYRYTDATLEEMYAYLDRRLPWVRPTDTGRSTNCLINQVGIYVHKKEKGYNNYAFPYSWDVRIGHKERDAALEEINEAIDVEAVQRIMGEIGYRDAAEGYDARQLVAYYTGDGSVTPDELRSYLAHYLPDYSIPQLFVPLQEMPLTNAGKVDRRALTDLGARPPAEAAAYAAPEGEIEELLAEIWRDVLSLDRIGRHDRFIDLGGHSLTAIRLSARIGEAFALELPLHRVFELPTIALQGNYLEQTIRQLLAEAEAGENSPEPS